MENNNKIRVRKTVYFRGVLVSNSENLKDCRYTYKHKQFGAEFGLHGQIAVFICINAMARVNV